MTLGFKDMIARCIAMLRRGDCSTCDNRATCVIHRMGAFAAPEQRDPVGNFFGGLAKAFAVAMERPGEITRLVEARLEAHLEKGEVGIDRIAADLGLSRQTLYRRLRDEGVTFERLLDKLRHRLALRYLREQRLSVKATSYLLGFSDPAAFSRAFKRWTGFSPRAATA